MFLKLRGHVANSYFFLYDAHRLLSIVLVVIRGARGKDRDCSESSAALR